MLIKMIKNTNIMKTKILLLSFALIASLSSAFALLKLGDGGMGSGGMQFQMQMSSRMAFVAPPVMTVITPKSDITIIFNKNMGVVYTTIKRNTGMAISRSRVDTSLDTSLEINIANLPRGSYTLVVTDKLGATIKSEKFTVD